MKSRAPFAIRHLRFILVLCCLPFSGWAQSIYIQPGATITVSGTGTIRLEGTFENHGTFTAGDGTVVFQEVIGNGTPGIGGTNPTSFNNLTVNLITKTLNLLRNIGVEGTVNFSSGLFDLNGFDVTLGANGLLMNESETSRFTGLLGGSLIKTMSLNFPVGINPGNLGAIINSNANLGLTTIRRSHVPNNINGLFSIERVFSISPANNTGLNATLRFEYFDAEMNSLNESNLILWKKVSSVWVPQSATVPDHVLNFLELENISGFSEWTAAEACKDGSGNLVDPQTWYEDADGDGYGNPASSPLLACDQPAGFVSNNTDCDDADADEFPGQTWYIDADGDDYGASSTTACTRPANGFLLSELSGNGTDDCDDADADEFPGQTWYIDADGDDYGASSTTACTRPANGFLLSELSGNGTDDCDDNIAAINPAATEVCDGVDNNCNSNTDEGNACVVTLSPIMLQLNETGETTGTFTVSLGSAPPVNVTIQLAFNSSQLRVNTGSGLGASPQTITLTPANALTGVTVTVQAIDDAIDEADPHQATITTATTSSSSSFFNALEVHDVVINIADNDVAGATITENSSTANDNTITVFEGGAGSSFNVVLNTPPSADVEVSMTFNDTQIRAGSPTPGTTPQILYFTPVNWNTPQTVNVEAINGLNLQSVITSNISLAVGSSDPAYIGAPVQPSGTVVVHLLPCPAITAEIAGTTTICPGGATNLSVTINGGTSPYTVIYSPDGGTTQVQVDNYISGTVIPVNPPNGVTTYTLVSVTDANSCAATPSGSAIVTVSDTQIPTITCPQTQALILDANCFATLPNYIALATANDNCGVQSVTQSPAPGTLVSGAGPMSILLTVTDINNNTNACSFTLNKVDNTPPTVQCFNQTITFNGEPSLALDSDDLANASDNCGIQSIVLSTPAITCQQVGQLVPVIVTAKDLSNNTATCTSFITVGGLPCGWSQNPDGVNCQNGNSVAFNPATSVWTATSTNCYYASPFTGDETAFAQRALCGNGSITALVTSMSGTALGWAGVVMRESNAPGAKKAQLMTNLSSFSRREFRTETNGASIPQQIPSLNRYWLRIVRTANQFAMYVSPNGTAWYFAGAQTIAMSNCIQMGLAITNYTANSTVTATFSHVSFTGSNGVLAWPGEEVAPLAPHSSPLTPDFDVYPNPTSGELNLDLTHYIGRSVRIETYSLEGKLLQFNELDEMQNALERLDLDRFHNGLYLVKVKSDGLPDVTKRIVLQR